MFTLPDLFYWFYSIALFSNSQLCRLINNLQRNPLKPVLWRVLNLQWVQRFYTVSVEASLYLWSDEQDRKHCSIVFQLCVLLCMFWCLCYGCLSHIVSFLIISIICCTESVWIKKPFICQDECKWMAVYTICQNF